ncbi:hypothetical protein AB0H57_28240 [Micromonospora sp. NPDC050686]|uniref:hypothetical protein n=1 Tax=Micromonospora sp. NPDC050686 TaxID=3154631 RepID=UPI0033F32982
MSTHCFVGTTDSANPHLVHARFVLFDCHPGVVVPTLAAIWVGHAHRDAHALNTAILASDWEYLARYRLAGCLPPSPDATSTPTSRSPAARYAPRPAAGAPR